MTMSNGYGANITPSHFGDGVSTRCHPVFDCYHQMILHRTDNAPCFWGIPIVRLLLPREDCKETRLPHT